MKKLFALLISVSALGSVYAQHGDRNEYGNNRKQPTNAPYSQTVSINTRERDIQIDRINHDFDQKIAYVRKDRRLRPWEKNRQISMLEKQRDQETRELMARFSSSRNGRYDDGYAKNNRRF